MISRSPQRDTFQRDGHIRRSLEDGKEPDVEYLDMFKTIAQKKLEQEADPEWQKDNMEYDLRSTDWILAKVRNSNVYAQNLYAAMCNNEFQKLETWPILAGQTCSYSWRYAGGIIADMQQKGDYIDWYCSGIRNGADTTDEEYNAMTKEQQEAYIESKSYVSESFVTDEIREDLQKLGWAVIEDKE